MMNEVKRKQLFSEMLWASVKKTIGRSWLDHDELLDIIKRLGYPERTWDGLIEGIEALPYLKVGEANYEEVNASSKERCLKDTLIALLKSHSVEMEDYYYLGSNPGIPVADFEEVADEFLSSLAEYL